jgi:transcriptional regulator with XRE-family HTH domain
MRVAEIRKQKGLSQTDLAEMVGVEQPTISRFEQGGDGITLRLIKQIADALEVSVADLFADDRTPAEQALIRAFRTLSPDRQMGWMDLAQALVTTQNQQQQ